VGYHAAQLAALRETINRADVDVIVSATPCNLAALIEINRPVVRARYEFSEAGEPALSGLVEHFLVEQRVRKQ
jgi:predicted GTPase